MLSFVLLPLPGQPADASALWVVITDDRFLSAAPGFDDAAIQAVLERAKSPLAAYTEPLGDDRFSAARSLFTASISRDNTLNPQVLLAILHADGQLQHAPQHPFTPTVQDIAIRLWDAYRAYAAGQRSLSLANGLQLPVVGDTNAASYALASFYAAQAHSEKELNAHLERWLQSYLFLFNQDPASEKVTVQSLPDIEPFLQLPFNQPRENFLRLNSFFDHVNPGISFDDTLLRFDGRNFTGAGFANCTLGVNCYGGHNGLDYSTGAGMPILAAASGRVVHRYYNTDPARGTVDSGLIIDHGNGYRTTYWHMDPIQVDINATVAQGQQIGLSGNIGKSSGAHLHFGLRLSRNNKSVNPYGWWSASTDTWGDSRWMWAGDLTADNREAQAQLFFRSDWLRDPNGHAGESFYTMSSNSSGASANWAIWGAFIPTAGTYNVFAYWPANSANTRSARYQVFHAGGSTTVTADQSSGGNEFVRLGSFSMARGPAAVILTDFTGESGRRVYFDALRWALQSLYPPTGLTLSQISAAENVPTGAQVATLSTTDADLGDVHTYDLVSGDGSIDNAAFSISGNRLLTAVPLDFEMKNSYAIRLRTTDSGGASFEKAFTFMVTNLNEAPTSLLLSPGSLLENQPAGTTVGTFNTTDQDAGDSYTYTLVSGTGSTDNTRYSISGFSLMTRAVFDFEDKPIHTIRARVTDSGGLWYEQSFNIQVVDVNEAPTAIQLSKSRVSEKRPVGTVVGLLSALDADAGDSHSFSLVTGSDDAGNHAFTIAENSLLTNAEFDLEVKGSYTIRIRAVDRAGLEFEKAFTITITPFNQPPTDISLSNSSVPENQPVDATVGSLSTTDLNPDDTFTYTLVEGEGSAGNPFFTINASTLRTAALFDFESRNSYTIRVRSSDSEGLFTEKAFTILVANANERPTALSLFNSSVDENQPAGTTVGSFNASDPDAGDTHRYTLVSGSGSADNGAFQINGSLLQTAAVFNFETRSTFSIRVRVTDSGGLTLEQPFTITINDINDAPTALELSRHQILENNLVGDEIGILSTLDQDARDNHTYHLVPSPGDSGNAAFIISGNRLLTAQSVDFETQTAYSVRVRVTDLGGLWFEREFDILVLPVNEYPPTRIQLSRASVPEHRPRGVQIGSLTALDADHGDWHTFQLVSGSGGQDNHLFAIQGDILRTAVSFDYELRSSYSIRLRVVDSGGLWHEQVFAITILDVLEHFFPLMP
ncbi:MAG TPA: cadherin domain-containing protein [Levilinea sp.]|nr:cadherin domain-containing protein [Levilinea sp.]